MAQDDHAGEGRDHGCYPLWSVGHLRPREAARLGPASVRFGSAVSPNRPRPICAALEFPMSQKSFADLGVSKAVVDALAKRGRTEPFAIQNLIIGDILAGRDVLAKSPTGSGKTLAFGVPMLDRVDANAYGRPSALVLAPTRELA